MTDHHALPPGTVTRMFHEGCPGLQGWTVFAAAEQDDAQPEALLRPGHISGMFTHDPGMTQPDERGWTLAREIIRAGGTAILIFNSLADATAFKARFGAQA